jgi:hypothetical protein
MTGFAEVTREAVRGVEERSGVESLDALHAERRQINKELLPLKALYGSHSVWDAKRQAMGRALQIKARMAIEARGEKPTEKYVEAEALGSPEFEGFVDRAISDRIRFLELETELQEVEERIRSREVELLVFNSELKLSR